MHVMTEGRLVSALPQKQFVDRKQNCTDPNFSAACRVDSNTLLEHVAAMVALHCPAYTKVADCCPILSMHAAQSLWSLHTVHNPSATICDNNHVTTTTNAAALCWVLTTRHPSATELDSIASSCTLHAAPTLQSEHACVRMAEGGRGQHN